MRFFCLAGLWAVIILSLALAGCTACFVRQNPQQLKEKTAQTTAALKRDAKAVAAGVREGWSRDKPLNVNTATPAQLASLPGINASKAERIVANRPYSKPEDLLNRGVLSRRDYERIADLLTVKK
ncbi:MAG TPA: helix-hairpin-helix domain-containing protein [Terriglobales bacterium]|nr:helix-hairpin-helix domain-containing protein [Terriglobales bacterium]